MGLISNKEGCGVIYAWIERGCREGIGYMPIYPKWTQGMSLLNYPARSLNHHPTLVTSSFPHSRDLHQFLELASGPEAD